MKNFDKPYCEVIKFGGSVMTSSACGCWDGEDDWGAGANCSGDVGFCSCSVNHSPAEDNCTPCGDYQGD